MNKIHRLHGGGRTLLWDSFTDDDGAELTAHPATGGGHWQDGAVVSLAFPQVASNRLTQPSNAGHMIHGSRLMRRNGSVSCDVVRVSGSEAAAAFVGLLIRASRQLASSQPRGSYDIRYQLSNTVTAWQLLRNSATQLGSNVSQSLTQDQAYRVTISARGSRLIVWVDGTIIFNTEDCSARRGFRVGLRLANNGVASFPLRLDNWQVTR